MAVMMFGHLILINLDVYGCFSPFIFSFSFGWEDISNT